MDATSILRAIDVRAIFQPLAFVVFSLLSAAPVSAQEPIPESCLKRVSVEGSLKLSQQLAEISAIQTWLETVQKENVDFAVWHNAQGKALKCKTVGTLGRVKCAVTARPCPPADYPQDGDGDSS